MFTVVEAAALLQTSRHTIHRAIRARQLKAHQVGRGDRTLEADPQKRLPCMRTSSPRASMGGASPGELRDGD
jgi:excisionase family DNA binding protein